MKHVIFIFDIESEELLESIEIPASRKKALAELMDWQEPEDEIYGYDLSAHQLRVLEDWTGRKIVAPGRLAQLSGIAD
jgi:hypothetical protein